MVNKILCLLFGHRAVEGARSLLIVQADTMMLIHEVSTESISGGAGPVWFLKPCFRCNDLVWFK
jgi:hypothetical protein